MFRCVLCCLIFAVVPSGARKHSKLFILPFKARRSQWADWEQRDVISGNIVWKSHTIGASYYISRPVREALMTQSSLYNAIFVFWSLFLSELTLTRSLRNDGEKVPAWLIVMSISPLYLRVSISNNLFYCRVRRTREAMS